MRTMTLVLFAVGCGGGSDISPYADGSLGIPEVEIDEELSSARKDLVGALAVDGSGENLTVQIDTQNGRTEVEVKAPGMPDLSVLDGLEGQLSIAEDALTDRLSLLVTDDQGPVYLLEPVNATVLTTETFGPGFVQVGADLGTVPVGLDHVRLYSALFETDDGAVEVFPGEPVEATIDGQTYRIVLVANWVRELSGDRSSECASQLDEALAYELTRVEPGAADLTPLTRPETVPIDGSTCLPQ